MARPIQISREKLLATMRLQGPVSATELAAALGAHRSTVVRVLAELGPQVAAFGATRSTRYAVRRAVRNAGNRWPLYRLEASGRAHAWAEIESLFGRRQWRINWAIPPPAWVDHFSDRQGLWEGYPFFLSDLRPQGFIGRAIARQVSPILQVPEQPQNWSDEDTMVYLQAAGDDLPGDLVPGDDCLRRALQRAMVPQPEDLLFPGDRASQYPVLAARTIQIPIGSSAGGEQPKFLLTLSDEARGPVGTPVLVKFSAPMDQPTGQRWADLLLAEYHAHEVLARQGLAMPGSMLFDSAGRRFLEIPRFDRTPQGGRRGVVSLAALHDSAIGRSVNHWPTAVSELQQAGLTDIPAVETVRRLNAFGELIGNTDMHHGNLAFWMNDTLPFRLAPSYDMLPMFWAPGPQGEIMERPFAPQPPLPADHEAWQEAAGWALEFWQQLEGDPRLSGPFRPVAGGARQAVQRLLDRVA